MPNDDIPELTATERARWAALRAAIQDAAQALMTGADQEQVQAALKGVAAIDLDHARVRDALHVPDDPGEHAAALERILHRIPPGWGRWISCHAGWYPLIIRTDAFLDHIDADYELHQIKEKWGCLEYYAATAKGLDVEQAMRAVTDAARAESQRVCEMCARAGAPVERQAWIKTLCATCAAHYGFHRGSGGALP